jgi:hypothetical protein
MASNEVTSLATVTGQLERNSEGFKTFQIMTIDGVLVPYSKISDDHREIKILVSEGNHKLTVRASDVKTSIPSFSFLARSATVTISADFKKEVEYRVYGEIKDELFNIWLEDPKSKKVLTSIGSAPWR